MQRWSNRPRITQTNQPLSIIRVRPGKPLTGIVLSHDVEGADLHYWKGRSKICDDQNCEACEANFKARWYGYIEIWAATTGRSVIVELTANAAPAIDAWWSEHHTLRAAVLEATRVNRKINSKLLVTFNAGTLTDNQLPAPRQIRKQLELMWECSTVARSEILQAPKRHEYDAEPRIRENGAASTRQSS